MLLEALLNGTLKEATAAHELRIAAMQSGNLSDSIKYQETVERILRGYITQNSPLRRESHSWFKVFSKITLKMLEL